jgi:hypothetical protein
MDKKGKAPKKSVKGDQETYHKSSAKENKAPKGKGKTLQEPQAHHRLSAYEEYAAKYPQESKVGHPA